MTIRNIARVKWFNPRSGYGFLTDCDNAEDIFVHHSEITTSGNVYKTLTQGEYVEYNTTTDDKGKVLAVNVTGIKQGPLLCERPKKSKKTNDKKSSESEQTTHEVKAVTDSQ